MKGSLYLKFDFCEVRRFVYCFNGNITIKKPVYIISRKVFEARFDE